VKLSLSVVAGALAAVAIAGTLAHRWVVFAQRPEFDVASVKVSAPDQDFGLGVRRTGDRVSIHMTHIATLITYAYRIPISQVANYEKSPIAYEWYDIDAKTNVDATEDQVRLMFQSLLEDRFQFKAHREVREFPKYVLMLAKGRLKMRPASSDDLMKVEIDGRQHTWPKGACWNTGWTDGSRIICHAVPMSRLVSAISGELRAPVTDQTGLTGTYDVIVHYTSDNAPPRTDAAEQGPSLAAALNVELGLKLEKGKGPVEVLFIDRLAKPAEN
jgi:uncharacterized protein (TIGR03435 family)